MLEIGKLSKNNSVEQKMTNIIDILEKRDLDGVIFDLDSTLIDTDQYYIDSQKKASKDLSKHLNLRVEYLDYRNIIKESFYKNNSKPQLITDQLYNGSIEYCLRNNIEFKERETFKQLLEKDFDYFYTTSPEIFPKTIELLHTISKAGKRIGIHTHGQEEWSLLKIKNLKEKYFKEYKEELKIDAIHITPFESKKDTDNWIRVGDKIKLELTKILVIGDNIDADIVSALEAGYTNLVHIKRNRPDNLASIIKTFQDLRPDVNLFAISVENIKDLLNPEL